MQPLTIYLGIQIHVVKQVESVCKCMHVAQMLFWCCGWCS